ncbi:polysaccharide biosynthesis C-terminal domain-containing protein [Kosakonia sp. BYX6]|uniref:Polysaccharide biosynthesis C-terminal domain-containing protein n=1 Tax=Kosakonia calanthes TaxID=3139408 RepID=A0ABZ3B9J7_9ENTR
MRNLVLYGLASGFSRGGMFLILPVLASFMSIADYGQFSLYIIIVQLLIPFISINISSIIGREVYERFRTALFFTAFFNRIAFVISLGCILVYCWVPQYFLLIIIYAFWEAIFLLVTTTVRFRSSAYNYFILCMSKMVLLIALLALLYFYHADLLARVDVLLIVFAVSNTVVIIPYIKITFGIKVSTCAMFRKISAQKAIILFALGILPHTVAQWVTSGSDRFFVKYFGGNEMLGYYSFSYAVAAIYMIINSSLALGIPQICVKSFHFFSTRKFYLSFFSAVTVLWFGTVLTINIVLYYLKLKYNLGDIFWVIYSILTGLYFLSFYYYYSSYLFYDRQARQLSGITIMTAIVNIGLVVILTPLLGMLGTALSTTISYFVYSFVTYQKVIRQHPNVLGLLYPTLFVFFLTVIIMLLIKLTDFLN